MNLGISGKRAVFIGGSSGLGYAVCERLAAEEVNLVVYARDPEKLKQCQVNLIDAHGITPRPISNNCMVPCSCCAKSPQ